VYACVADLADAKALKEQSRALPELSRPVILQTGLDTLTTALDTQARGVRFDCLMGRNVLVHAFDKARIIRQFVAIAQTQLPQPGHSNPRIVLAELVPCQTQRLYSLLPPDTVSRDFSQRLQKAEDAIYTPIHSTLWWDVSDLQAMFALEGLPAAIQLQRSPIQLRITPAVIQRWFAPSTTPAPSYGDYLRRQLADHEVQTLHDRFLHALSHQTVPWQSAIAYIAVP
jgi:putative ATPase